jgi:hypothetical protein
VSLRNRRTQARVVAERAHQIIFRRIHGHRVRSRQVPGKSSGKKGYPCIFPNRRKTSLNTKIQLNSGMSSGLFKAPYHWSFSEHIYIHYRKKVSNSGEVDVGPRLMRRLNEPFRFPPQTGSQGLDGGISGIFRNNFPARRVHADGDDDDGAGGDEDLSGRRRASPCHEQLSELSTMKSESSRCQSRANSTKFSANLFGPQNLSLAAPFQLPFLRTQRSILQE